MCENYVGFCGYIAEIRMREFFAQRGSRKGKKQHTTKENSLQNEKQEKAFLVGSGGRNFCTSSEGGRSHPHSHSARDEAKKKRGFSSSSYVLSLEEGVKTKIQQL